MALKDIFRKAEKDPLDGFAKFFQVKDKLSYTGDLYTDFLTQLGGRQFGGGLFNTFSPENVAQWTEKVVQAYPKFQGRLQLIGYNWLGSCYALDSRSEKIVMFDIAAGTAGLLPVSLADFLNVAIPQRTNICLQSDLYKQWRKVGPAPKYGNCIGCKVPMFLSGELELD